VPTDPSTPPTDPATNDTTLTPTDPTKNDTQKPEDTKPADPVTPPSEPGNVVPSNATAQEVSEFFSKADTDKDGYVTKDEVKAAFSSFGQNISDAELDAFYAKADKDADAKLTLDEMKVILVPSDPKPEDSTTPTDPSNPPVDNSTEPVKNETTPVQPVTPAEPEKVLPPNATEQEVSDFFRTADSDADGFLTKEEIKAAFIAKG
jgi:Ca2+-binding EF-hand superfamily protein